MYTPRRRPHSPSRSPLRCRAARTSLVQVLEPRLMLAGSAFPSPREQQMLELMNRFRTDPGPELSLLLNSTTRHPDALRFFTWTRTALPAVEAAQARAPAGVKRAAHPRRAWATRGDARRQAQSNQLPGEPPLAHPPPRQNRDPASWAKHLASRINQHGMRNRIHWERPKGSSRPGSTITLNF